MASWDFCINAALESKSISNDVANRLIKSNNVEDELSAIVLELTQQKREMAIAATRIAKRFEDISSHEKGEYEGLLSTLSKDRTGKAGYANVEYNQDYYRSKYHANLADMLQRFRTRKLGLEQDEAGLHKLIRAAYGEKTDDELINSFGRDWLSNNDAMRRDFNKMGGSISKNESHLLPQNHDLRSTKSVTQDQWVQTTLPRLDLNQMTDRLGVKMSTLPEDEVTSILGKVYDTIVTGGLNKLDDLQVPRMGQKLSRRHSQKRFLYFKDADSWIAHQKEFGKGDIFTTLTDHVDAMAHDVGLMELYGPNPQNTFDALVAQIEKNGGITPGGKTFSGAIFNVVSGKVNQGELTSVADFMQSTRNVLVASTLGKAFLSSISDVGFSAITAKYNGLSAMKVFKSHLATLTDESRQLFAVKIGLIADNMIGRAHSANRYADVYGTGLTSKVSEAVMRASLLEPWTAAGRKAFGMEYASMLAENFGKSISDLDKNLLRAFKEYGIDEVDWNKFRQSKALKHKKNVFADFTQDGGVKFHQMVLSETDFAVPMPDAKVQAITTGGGSARGTVTGQAWRSAMMLKSFAATVIMTHFYRAAYQATNLDKLKYTATLLATTTILGGIALQAKDIAAGRDPRKIDDKFMIAALQQGGGLGIFGDFIFSDVNRFGGGITETLTGPTGQLLDTTVRFTLGNVREALSGEETNVLGEGVKILNRYTPDIWQTHLIMNAFFDQIEMMVDDDAAKRFNRITRKRKKDFEQGYWWKPGNFTPDRAPDLSAVGDN